MKKLFLKISRNSKEHTCARVSFLIKLRPQAIKRLWHRCFPLNFAKFSRTPFLTAHLRCLFLKYLFLWKYLSFSEFKVGPSPSKKNCSICFNKNTLKMMKNVFSFTLKVLFVLKIFNFLCWFFGYVEKTTWLERQG